MHIYQLLFTNCVMISLFIWIIIFIIQTKFVFFFIIVILNRLFFHFVITLGDNRIGAEGAKALVEALKLNKNLTSISIGNFLRLFHNNSYLIIIVNFGIFHF